MSEQNATDDEVGLVARAICRHRAGRACDWRGKDRCANGCQAPIANLLADFHEVGHQARAAIAAMKESRAATERWAAFGRAVMAQHKDGDCGDVDGGWLQETGVQTGVLQIIEAKEPCAEEGCACAATCGDWPVDCYRVVTP